MNNFNEVKTELNERLELANTALSTNQIIQQTLFQLVKNQKRLIDRALLLIEAFEVKDLTGYRHATIQMQMVCYAVGIDYLWEGDEELIEKGIRFNA